MAPRASLAAVSLAVLALAITVVSIWAPIAGDRWVSGVSEPPVTLKIASRDSPVLVPSTQIADTNRPSTNAGTTYSVSFSTSPSSCGSIDFGGVNYSDGQSASVMAGNYSVSATPCSGGILSGLGTFGGVSIVGGQANVTGSGGISATFVGAFALTFVESGLPVATQWSVVFNHGFTSANTTTIRFSGVFDGVYNYSVLGVAGYSASPSGGAISVNGSNVTEPIVFSTKKYMATFEEFGLPSGAAWNVTLQGIIATSRTSTITFFEPNGTYNFTIWKINGYRASPSGGLLTVNGSDVTQGVAFTLVTYSVIFTEMGLPSRTLWNVTLSGVKESSATTQITFVVPNGTYDYALGRVGGFRVTDFAGSLTVDGTQVGVAVQWNQVTYMVSFSESGLTSGTKWWVNVTNGPSTSSMSTTLSFSEPNGTQTYMIATTNKMYASPGGSVSIDGGPLSKMAIFNQVTYAVTFNESGLPVGTQWWVSVAGGAAVSSTSATLAFDEPNGSYTFSVLPVSGYSASPSNGPISVKGHGFSQAIKFSSVSSAKFLGLPPSEGYGALGGIIAVVVVSVGAIGIHRRRRSSQTTASDPPSDPEVR